MKDKDDGNDKHFELCQLYEKIDSTGQETLVKIADRLLETQSSISKDKAKLKVETNKQEMA